MQPCMASPHEKQYSPGSITGEEAEDKGILACQLAFAYLGHTRVTEPHIYFLCTDENQPRRQKTSQPVIRHPEKGSRGT